MNVYIIIVEIIVLVFSVIIHEVSHGYVANMLGDPTAKEQGRLTLNPIPHIDPFMSIILPAILIISQAGFIIGGAKPVPINPLYFRHHKRDVMLVSLAGPGSNLLLMMICAGIAKLGAVAPFLQTPFIKDFLYYGIIINAVLAFFNLVPIPPLDGSKVLAFFLPDRAARAYLSIEPYGIWIIVALMATRLLNIMMAPVLIFLGWLLNMLF